MIRFPTISVRMRTAAWIGMSNAAALGLSLASLLISVHLMDAHAFSGYAVALAIQALCFTVATSVGPGCARILAREQSHSGSCRVWRRGSGWVSAVLLAVTGNVAGHFLQLELGVWVWILLALQMPLASLEAHQLQILQMQGRFGTHALLSPLSRAGKAAGLGIVFLAGGSGPFWVVAAQTAAQLATWIVMSSRMGTIAPSNSPARFDWRSSVLNTLSGSVVWGATRANILMAKSRLDPVETGLYGLAETLSSSLLVAMQSLMTLIQPGIYRWNPQDGIRPLLRRAALLALVGSILSAMAAVLAGPAIELLLDRGWHGASPAFAALCVGAAFQSWVAVPAAVLHRLNAGRTILFLEILGGSTMLASTWSLASGSTATDAAWCWAAGRGIWAIGGILATSALVRRAIREA